LSIGWFDALPKKVKAAVHSRCTRLELPPGKRLFKRGTRSDAIYCVLKGAIRVSGTASDGQETVLDFYGPNVWFGEVSVLDGLPRTHDARSETDSILLQLSGTDLEDLLADYPAFSRGLLKLESLRLRLLLTAIESYSIQPLEKRLANRLLMLAVSFAVEKDNETYLNLHLPQETLAQLIGSTRQRINQIFKDWEALGLASQQYGRISLMDRAALEALAAL
jgi:CRP-like cAMP-binding protein